MPAVSVRPRATKECNHAERRVFKALVETLLAVARTLRDAEPEWYDCGGESNVPLIQSAL